MALENLEADELNWESFNEIWTIFFQNFEIIQMYNNSYWCKKLRTNSNTLEMESVGACIKS